MSLFVRTLTAFALTVSSFTFITLPAAQAAENLIPVEHFFERSTYNGVWISPTGQYLAIKASEGTRDSIIIYDRQEKKVVSNFAFGDSIRFEGIFWANDERIVFTGAKFVGYLDNQGGRPSLYAANADGSNRREIFRVERSGYRVLNRLPDDPEHILIEKRHFADQGEAKAHLLNIYDSRTYFVGEQPPKANGLISDNTGRLRAAVAYEEERSDEFGKGTSWLYYRSPGSDEWKELQLEGFDARRAGFGGFSADNRYAYLMSSHDSPRTEVFQFDTETGEMEKIASDPIADVTGVVSGLDGDTVGFQAMPNTVRRIYTDDSASAKLLQSLEQAFPGQVVDLTSLTSDRKTAVVHVWSATNPGEYYLFDTETLAAAYIASPKPKLDPSQMGEVRPIEVEARDGLMLHGYLTLPNGYQDGTALPTIVNIHGGPHGPRDTWSFSRENQFFANRGYAVLQINFRGSGGYGQEFEESGYQKWGREMQDDVTDATLWAIEQGFSDPDRICVYGGSYGGYSSLMAVIREPDLYQCSVGYVGVYSLEVMKEEGDIVSRRSGRKYLDRVLGEDVAVLRANSPANNVDKIKVPLFIVHGENDVRVPMDQYYALTEALDDAGIKYKSMVREEGHGFQLEENLYDLYNALEDFFGQHIGAK
ncbi:alpha/beta hydrolase family protein [Pseudidiomarina taiwanensis]|uniref:S9 family peptidase n=1 Tax=Pseudidiomarina taiwanensis TaxID=337250 RepID=A0A432ZK60_9GAMM|nr:prolyl oligopeptidase family serine peptidase [Pseudidiomarina taiwanensis]RUO78358.1 S9 family peptidase [Pseudidiomarina taiwanensis]